MAVVGHQAALRDRKMAFVKHQLSRVERLKQEKSNVAQRLEADRQAQVGARARARTRACD